MAISRSQKEQILAQLKDCFSRAKSFVISNYKGLTVRDMADFRGRLSKTGASYNVAKKTLIKKAASECGYTLKDNQLEGAVGVAFAFEDELAPMRITYKFSKENGKLKPVCGMMGNEELATEKIKQLALLPSHSELFATLVGSLKSPISGFVYVLAGPMRGFQSVITQIHKQKNG